MKRYMVVAILMISMGLAMLSGCADKRIPWRDAFDASGLTWDASIFESENGRISFLYEKGKDELYAVEDTDRIHISFEKQYSVVIDYYQGVQNMDEAEKELRESYQNTAESTLSDNTEAGEIAGYTGRHISLSGSLGEGGVYFCNTETGYLCVYYMSAADCGDDDRVHMENIVQSVRVGQFLESGVG